MNSGSAVTLLRYSAMRTTEIFNLFVLPKRRENGVVEYHYMASASLAARDFVPRTWSSGSVSVSKSCLSS